MLCILGGYAGYLLLHIVGFYRLHKPSAKQQKTPDAASPENTPNIGVVVPFRNEAALLPLLLEHLAAQEYPADSWEVILVNDHSTDNGPALVQQFLEGHGFAAKARLVHLPDGYAGKKAALASGIAQTNAEYILTTDADCAPGPHWLQNTAKYLLQPTTVAVCGPVRLTCLSNAPQSTLLLRLQQLESAGLVLLGAGAVGLGYASLANGANFCFRKSSFQEVDGYSGIDHVASGDDELLLHKLWRHWPQGIRFQTEGAAVVPTRAASQWKELWQQRIRWVSKTTAYRNLPMQAGQWIGLLGMLTQLAAIVLLFLPAGGWAAAGFLVGKFLVDALQLSLANRWLGNRQALPWIPLLWLLYPFYVLWVAFAGNFSGTYTWKGRNVR
mgnify:CR=1 FL=1